MTKRIKKIQILAQRFEEAAAAAAKAKKTLDDVQVQSRGSSGFREQSNYRLHNSCPANGSP